MTDYNIFLEKMRSLGMNHKWAITFTKRLADDEKVFPVEDPVKKRWALERGFYPGRIELYGLTEENYRNYMPDYHYSMMHPLNNHFLKWLDKTTLKYVMNSGGCAEYMPKYYVYVENDGSFTYLMDHPLDIEKNEEFLMNLLKRYGCLAMKPNSGTEGGMGFIKLELRGEKIFENNREITPQRVAEIRDSMRNYIITEYARQHKDLEAVWPGSECTLRVIMCKDPKKDLYAAPTWTCIASYARFGTRLGGGASNMESGGIGAGFDFETGIMNGRAVQYKEFAKDGKWMQDAHPDTKVKWKGMAMPNWDIVRKGIDRICGHISSLDYLGLDIIITENGMKICEINSLPAMAYLQLIGAPPLSSEKVRAFFDHKGYKKFDGKDFLRAYEDSQV